MSSVTDEQLSIVRNTFKMVLEELPNTGQEKALKPDMEKFLTKAPGYIEKFPQVIVGENKEQETKGQEPRRDNE